MVLARFESHKQTSANPRKDEEREGDHVKWPRFSRPRNAPRLKGFRHGCLRSYLVPVRLHLMSFGKWSQSLTGPPMS